MEKTLLNYPHLPPDLALWLTLSGSNYPCLEQLYMVPKMFEPLRFDCTCTISNFVWIKCVPGSCKSYEYGCDNGRCIDDSLSCGPYKSCGYEVECNLSSRILMGFTVYLVGAVLCLSLIVLLMVCYCGRSRKLTTVGNKRKLSLKLPFKIVADDILILCLGSIVLVIVRYSIRQLATVC